MNISIILKIAGVGLLVAVAAQILQKTGRDEQATFLTLAGVVVVMIMLIGEISDLFSLIRSTFNL